MAKKDKRRTIVYLIHEGETRDNHIIIQKTKTLVQENRKLKSKSITVKRVHELFVEAKSP